MFKHILLPLDGSKLAEVAIPFAVEFCRKLDAQITLLHVIEKDAPSEVHGQRHLTNEPESCDYLGDIADRYFGFCAKVEKHVHTEEVSEVSASIVDHSSELKPDLIILTAHGAGGLRNIIAGSIAQQVIGEGKVAVLLIKPVEDKIGEVPSFSNILIPLDGEPAHEQSLKVAGELAAKLTSRMTLVRVVPTITTLTGKQATVGTLLPGTTNAYLEIAEEEASEYLQKKIDVMRAKGLDCGAEILRGDVATEIITAAHRLNTDMIILGTHGKAGLSAFWAGSVAPKIVSKTHLPILLVPVRRE